MPGQGSRHITVADLKADRVGPSLDAVIDKINQVERELPEKESNNERLSNKFAKSKRKWDSAAATGDELTKRGIKLMTELQQLNKEKKKHEEAQAKLEEEFENSRRESIESQEEVDTWTRELTSAKRARRTLTRGRNEIANLQATISASGKDWMADDVIQAGNKALSHYDDLKAEGRIDDIVLKEYQAEVLEAKKVMGDALWDLMLIQMEADDNDETVTILKSSLLIKYLWYRNLTSDHPQCNETIKSLRSAKKENNNTRQVAMATEICDQILIELDCVEETTDVELRFSQEAKEVAEGLIWN